jgi:hypothetical protein
MRRARNSAVRIVLGALRPRLPASALRPSLPDIATLALLWSAHCNVTLGETEHAFFEDHTIRK